MSHRASSKSRRSAKSSRGKRLDESEKALTGAGWTFAATQKYLELTTEEEKLNHLFAMFTVTPEQYKYNMRTTINIDFHLHNALFCEENKFDVQQTQFVCRTFDRVLQFAIQEYNKLNSRDPSARVRPDTPTKEASKERDRDHKHASSSVNAEGSSRSQDVSANYFKELYAQNPIQFNKNIESIKSEMFDRFQQAFNDVNQNGEFCFSTEVTETILNFFASTLIKPLRLLLYNASVPRPMAHIALPKKVFIPISPVPLDQCQEQFPVVAEELEFKPFRIPGEVINLEDAREMINRYTDDVIATINKRYDVLDDLIAKIQSVGSER